MAPCAPFRVVASLPALLAWAACGGEPVPERPDIQGPPTLLTTSADVPPGAQAISVLGDTLFSPLQPESVREAYLERYREAEDELARNPEDVDALIWMGRRTAYLGQFREAIDVYSYALTLHPLDPRLYRHRGHRYLTVREPERAVADFSRGLELTEGLPDEVEPDGLPNARGIPTSTLQFNLWYHLGLAHYVMGDLSAAATAYDSCMAVAAHPDAVVATAYWLYMTLRRLGRDAEAAGVLEGLRADLDVIESTSYRDLLLLFKGERTLEDLVGPSTGAATLQSTTTAYGLGVWHLLEGRPDEARTSFEQIIAARDQWPAFGYLSAEAEIARFPDREEE